MFWRRPALRAGRRLSTGPPPAFGGRRPHKIPPTRIQKLFFLTQTFFLGGNSPQRTRSVGRGRSKCPSYHPPTPYTLSPLLKGGEGRGEGGSDNHVPCPFGALLVTLYHFNSKTFLM
jgi:hypothetical protein